MTTLEQLHNKILILPKSDFPSLHRPNNEGKDIGDSAYQQLNNSENQEFQAEPPLLLFKLPPSLQINDLSCSHFSLRDQDNDDVNSGGGGVSDCRLINESKGVTFDLMKVESSNAYVMFPPPSKRAKTTTTMAHLSSPRRQAKGRLLREKNTFFLECAATKHNLERMIADYLRINCIYPQSRGISISQLSKKFRYSKKEVVEVLTKKIRAFPIPSENENRFTEQCYGLLSEEIEKDTWNDIVSVLSEWDGAIDYAKKGVIIEEMVKVILAKENEIDEDVVRYCLMQCTISSENGTGTQNVLNSPSSVTLDAKYIAQKIAHQIFNSRMRPWKQSHFLLEWHRLMPGVGKEYEPNADLLRGIAISTAKINPVYKDEQSTTLIDNDTDEGANNALYWKYFPKEALPYLSCEKFKAIFKEQDRWKLEDLEPYLDKQNLESDLMEYTRRIEDESNSIWYILKQ